MSAKHGEFCFAKFVLSDGTIRNSPVFVISNDNDKHDIIVCKCTGQPPRSEYDVNVQLRRNTCVRANKIYTIGRDQLLFEIQANLNPEIYNKIISKIAKALNIPIKEG